MTVFAAACLVATISPAIAEEPPAASSHSLLEQMNREAQGLYKDVRGGVVHLQLPPPRWLSEVAARDNPVDKWGGQLAEQVKQKLERDRQSAQQGKYNIVRAKINPTTQPQSINASSDAAPAPWRLTQEPANNTIVLESTGNGDPVAIQIQTGGQLRDGSVIVGGPPQLTLEPTSGFAPNNVGLIFDDAGHLLVPLYLEKETVGEGVRASVGDGPVLTATFVASDKQTNITVLQLPANAGKPVKLGASRPADGAMVMLLAPNSDSAKLMLWTGGQRDIAGVVVGVDGAVAGFARYGQFLSAGACKPVVEQLVATGKVKRAILGVTVREVPRGDPTREQSAALGNQPALRIEEVRPNSAAARAELHPNDLILTVDGEPVGDPAGFAAAIANRSGKTPMRVLRAGKRIDVTVELQAE